MPAKLRKLSDFLKKDCKGNLREAGRRLNIDWVNIDHWAKRGIKPCRPYEEKLAALGFIAG